jgi:AraC-like DNA-binding protein
MGSLQLISTESAKPSKRLGFFKETVSALFGIEPKIISTAPFVASWEFASLGGIGFCRLKSSAHQLAHVGAKRDCDNMIVVLQIRGSQDFQQGNREVLLAPGQWSVYDMAKGDTVNVSAGSESLMLVIPHEKIDSKCYELNQLTVRPFSGGVGVGKLAWNFMRSAFEEISTFDSQFGSEIVDTISHLIRLTLLDCSGDAAVQSGQGALRDRIKSYIRMHLRDPELSLDQIAAALKCTKRYLHMAFQGEGITISDYIWQFRLDRCHAEILNPNSRAKVITDIAFSWGFNSSAHFSTAFKERFGAPPNRYRKDEQSRMSSVNGRALVMAAKN